MPKTQSEDSSPPVELSQATMDKFDELTTAQETVEEAEAQEAAETTERSPRTSDEGLNEDGTLKIEEEEEPEDELEDESEDELEDEPEEKSEGAESDEEKTSLPNRLVQAAYRNGLSDEDILLLGDSADKVLSKMADNTDKISTQLGELGRLQRLSVKEPAPADSGLLKFKDALESESEDGDDRFKQIEKSHNALLNRLATVEQTNRQRASGYMTSTVDGFLDGKVKDYSELGDSKNLTDAALATRRGIAENAGNIILGAQQSGKQVSLPEALEMAFSIYEGGNAKTTIRANLVKEAEKRSKQITSRPSRRKTEVKFSSGREKAMDSYRKKAASQGLPLSNDDDF